MNNQIIIVGGGISGLSVLHALSLKYAKDRNVKISLIESQDHVGGTINTISRNNCHFEEGPNGFIGNRHRTHQLISELDLDKSVVKAQKRSQNRFIKLNSKLHKVPTKPQELLTSKLLSFNDKIRLFMEIMIPPGKSDDETVAEFGTRRFGDKITQSLIDPMIKGIYAGNIQNLSLKNAFPTLHKIDKEEGSIIKHFIKKKKKKSSSSKDTKNLLSMKHGVGQLTNQLYQKYKDKIVLNCNVLKIRKSVHDYFIETSNQMFLGHTIIFCTPAYITATLIADIDRRLAELLNQIFYAPVAVVGLVFLKSDIEKLPNGFGYLIPSSEQSPILGVLLESNVFPNRCEDDQVMVRILMGGVSFSEITDYSKDQLIGIAIDELERTIGIKGSSKDMFYRLWPKGIPQYDTHYAQIIDAINTHCKQHTHLHFLANYLNGVGMNDCIENAYKFAEECQLN